MTQSVFPHQTYIQNNHCCPLLQPLISTISYIHVASSVKLDVVGCINTMCVDGLNKVQVKVKHLNTIILAVAHVNLQCYSTGKIKFSFLGAYTLL